jgi:hypothetical protein
MSFDAHLVSEELAMSSSVFFLLSCCCLALHGSIASASMGFPSMNITSLDSEEPDMLVEGRGIPCVVAVGEFVIVAPGIAGVVKLARTPDGKCSLATRYQFNQGSPTPRCDSSLTRQMGNSVQVYKYKLNSCTMALLGYGAQDNLPFVLTCTTLSVTSVFAGALTRVQPSALNSFQCA